jgi:polyribonucleotide nucleotidyltransferase
MYKSVVKTIDLSGNRTIEIETGKLAKQSDGAVVVKQGDTMLLATVTCAKEAKEDVDFMPLQVEYKEKYASAGRFPGGFMKRESRSDDYEILISRLVDRALRPLFPDDFHAEVFVTVFLISADKDIMPDALAGLTASAALAVSDIPFNGPISEVRVARINENFVINPTFTELEEADLDIMVGATIDNILMVEGEMDEVSEQVMLEAIKVAHAEIKKHCKAQLELSAEVGKEQKREYSHEVNDENLEKLIWEKTYDKVYKTVKTTPGKQDRSDALETIQTEFTEEYASTLPEGEEVNELLIARYYHEVEKKAVRSLILDEKKRVDGRKSDEIRPIWSEVDYLPAAHGSSIFTRGETQSLTTVTLGTKLDEKIIDEVLIQGTEKFVLHYNFPPFSTGEAKPMRGTGRREIGHGNLAHRALKRMIPEDNPYAIRVVSDILESNGSSSMATVCAGTLALMDSGVQIKKPVSGIAMGLITDTESGQYAILSDILGDEDHLGDMDFKVAGTKDGITATQMDIKVEGLSYELLAEALEQAKKGRLHILGKMMETISTPRPDYKPHVPRIEKIIIPKEMIGPLIGPGGKVIQEIQSTTGSTIVIEEVDNVGVVDVFAVDKESIEAALTRIRAIVEVPEIGKIYKGKVKSIVSFGAFIEILPNKDGLLHISEIEWRRVQNVEEVLKVGEMVEVKLIDIDAKTGNLKLSRKALLPKPEKADSHDRPERSDRQRNSDHNFNHKDRP